MQTFRYPDSNLDSSDRFAVMFASTLRGFFFLSRKGVSTYNLNNNIAHTFEEIVTWKWLSFSNLWYSYTCLYMVQQEMVLPYTTKQCVFAFSLFTSQGWKAANLKRSGAVAATWPFQWSVNLYLDMDNRMFNNEFKVHIAYPLGEWETMQDNVYGWSRPLVMVRNIFRFTYTT